VDEVVAFFGGSNINQAFEMFFSRDAAGVMFDEEEAFSRAFVAGSHQNYSQTSTYPPMRLHVIMTSPRGA
jgi:hypothetical protein